MRIKYSKNISTSNRNVIYTSIIGGYDKLHDPLFITPGWDYICFTDDKNLKSDTWDVRYIDVDPSLSARKNSRKIKYLYNQYVGSYEKSVYVDGYALVKIDLTLILNTFDDDVDMVSMLHPYRDCLYEEAKYVMKFSGDPTGLVTRQIDRYKNENMPEHFGLTATGLIIRKKQDDVIKHCELIYNEIIKYSPVDQVAFPYIMWKHNLIKLKKISFKHWTKWLTGEDHHIWPKKEIWRNATM